MHAFADNCLPRPVTMHIDVLCWRSRRQTSHETHGTLPTRREESREVRHAMGRPPSAPLPLSWTELFDAQPLSVRLLLWLNSTLLLLLLLRPLILLLRLIPRGRSKAAKRAPQAPVAIALSRRSAPPKPIRKDGEWPRVEPSELDPALCKAWQQLCAAAAAATAPEDATPEDAAIYGPVQPIEEYDTLRALKARRLNLPRTLEWLHGHRRWWRENQPRQKRFCMQGDPGVQVCLGSGMARWFALDKRGTPYFYTDLQCWAPHLVSCADHTNFAIAGLELMREAGRQFCPGAPEHLTSARRTATVCTSPRAASSAHGCSL